MPLSTIRAINKKCKLNRTVLHQIGRGWKRMQPPSTKLSNDHGWRLFGNYVEGMYTQNNLNPTVKYNGGPRNLYSINGIVDSMKYKKILNENLSASAKQLQQSHDWIFPKGSDPKHKSFSTQKWFNNDNQAYSMPSQSCNVNIFETCMVC